LRERETDIVGWKAWKLGRNETKRKKKKKEDEIMNEEENTSLLRRIATKLGQKEDLMRVA
jgi:hypothetical protein